MFKNVIALFVESVITLVFESAIAFYPSAIAYNGEQTFRRQP
jgi:hypothetical protein